MQTVQVTQSLATGEGHSSYVTAWSTKCMQLPVYWSRAWSSVSRITLMCDCIVELQNDSLFKFKVGEKAGTVGRHRVDLFVLPDHLFFLKLFFHCLASHTRYICWHQLSSCAQLVSCRDTCHLLMLLWEKWGVFLFMCLDLPANTNLQNYCHIKK